jgi:hypothetical protein
MKKRIQRLLFTINSLVNIHLNVDYEACFVASLKIVRDLKGEDFHQGYKKYLAQVRLFEPRKIYLKNCLAIPVLCIFLPLLIILKVICTPKKHYKVKNVYMMADHPTLRQIQNWHANRFEIKERVSVNPYQSVFMADDKVLHYLIHTVSAHRYLILHPYLLLILLMKLIQYNGCVVKYMPDRIFSFNERAFVAPFITEFLNQQNIEHNLIMHGYRTFNVKDAFCHYDRIYVFGEYFSDLFRRLSARSREILIMGHPSMKTAEEIKTNPSDDSAKVLIVLQEPDVLPLFEITRFLKLMAGGLSGFSAAVKPRPDAENWLVRYFPELPEERHRDNSTVLDSYEIFCSKHSTFLIEAWARGKKVILLGKNALPIELLQGDNVLRLSLDKKLETSERNKLRDFLAMPGKPDWEKIHYVFANINSTGARHPSAYEQNV